MSLSCLFVTTRSCLRLRFHQPTNDSLFFLLFTLNLCLISALGNAALDVNDLQQALDYHQRDLNLGKTKGNDEAISRGLSNVGRVYARLGQFDKVCSKVEFG